MKYNKMYVIRLTTEPWILGRFPKIAVFLESLKMVERTITPRNSSSGKSNGVLVITTFPSVTHFSDQIKSMASTIAAKKMILGASKISVVNDVKVKGTKNTTKTINAVKV